ncbi:MAG: hypothetical protein KIT02_14515 [Devosia sp.]|uniref:hypothetical protein n=1 Tax=Devosia sp. TaxID=1871048 RepID=UPI0024C7B06A|nr:hypothetical protein [Devosia sp.]UYN99125.1 MAG: hypothetical protein KIT02_14515 [Devosia sp.]
MQFDSLRAFPYPVLRPGVDDYTDGDIQATIDFSQSIDGLEIQVEVSFVVSVPQIVELITAGNAEYAVVFACRDTYFRQAIRSQVSHFTHNFPSGSLRGEVLIYPYVLATSPIEGFVCNWINPEFGEGPFNFDKGAALAVDQPQSVYIDRDSFKPISSVFNLVKNDNLQYGEWRVEAGQEKVLISVHPALKERLDLARNDNKNKAILLNSIYFGAVMQCIAYLKRGDGAYDEFRWANIFRIRCEELAIDLSKHDEFYIAQQLMKSPFRVIDGYFFGESE